MLAILVINDSGGLGWCLLLWTIVEVFLSSAFQHCSGGIPGHLLHDLLHAEYAQLESKSIQCSTCHDDSGVVAFVALGACASSDSNGDVLVVSMKRGDAISNGDHTCYRQANRPEFSTSQEKSHCASMFCPFLLRFPWSSWDPMQELVVLFLKR